MLFSITSTYDIAESMWLEGQGSCWFALGSNCAAAQMDEDQVMNDEEDHGDVATEVDKPDSAQSDEENEDDARQHDKMT